MGAAEAYCCAPASSDRSEPRRGTHGRTVSRRFLQDPECQFPNTGLSTGSPGKVGDTAAGVASRPLLPKEADMPGWYVHLEAGHLAAERLRTGDLPPGYPLTPAEAAELGDIAHRWRNYLAAGALGPDLFFGLPDYKAGTGAL